MSERRSHSSRRRSASFGERHWSSSFGCFGIIDWSIPWVPIVTKSESDEHLKEAIQERSKFFAAVGYAIVQWANIDRALFDFCQFALNASAKKTAAIFYRSQTIGEHLGLTDSLMVIALPKRLQKDWGRLYKLIDNNIAFRNQIAHNPSAQVLKSRIKFGQSAEAQETNELFWASITEPTKTLRKSKKKSSLPNLIKTKDVLAHIAVVKSMRADINMIFAQNYRSAQRDSGNQHSLNENPDAGRAKPEFDNG